MSRPETETIDRLFLELSQFTTATTAKELALESAVLQLGIWIGLEKADLAERYSKLSEPADETVRTFRRLLAREVELPSAARLLRQTWGIEK